MAETAIDFDPYRVWLGVPDYDRPLNPYQLLGLPPLESNLARIQAAVVRQQEQLETIRTTVSDPQLWQQVWDELQAAIREMADPERKAVLDAALKRRGVGPRPRVDNTDPSGNGNAAGRIAAAGQTVVCRHCTKSNPTNRKFCGSCGKPLWEKCPKCNAECAADERFCGICGTDVHGNLDAQTQQLRQRKEAAMELLESHRYDAAISALRGIAAIDDPRFESFAIDALDEIKRVEARRDEEKQKAAQALVLATKYFERHAYDKSLSVIDEVPVPLRSDAHQRLLEKSRDCRTELLQLSGEIRQAVEEKRSWDLLPKIERLLMLKPDHTKAQELAFSLRDQFVKQAKSKLKTHAYEEAIASLEQIPSFAKTEEADSLLDTANELQALLLNLRLAALADPPLVALANRFLKIAASNPEGKTLKEKLDVKVKGKHADPRIAAPNWAPIPKRTMLGLPVDWLGHFTKFENVPEAVAEAMADQPGQFFVAAGLALQGIGRAAIDLNLMPGQKKSMLGAIGFSFGAKTSDIAWGIDLSEYALKAVKLTRDPKTKIVKLEQAEFIPHSSPLTHPDAELDRNELMQATLKDFLSRADLKGAKVVIAVPGHRVLGRFFELPPLPAKKVAGAVQYETKHQIPINLEELCWSHYILDERDAKTADEFPRRIMVVAAREVHVQERLAIFKTAGINVDIVQSECIAIHNAMVQEFYPDTLETDPKLKAIKAQGAAEQAASGDAIAIVDLGTESSNVVISTATSVWFRSFGKGGDTMTQALVKQFQLTYPQAEQLKREPSKARRFHLLHATMSPIFVQIGSEIERSIAGYHKLYSDHKVHHVYGIGGAFPTHGLMRHLRSGK